MFDGLYRVEYLNETSKHLKYQVWIFSNNVQYILYPSHDGIVVNYELPTHFFVKSGKFYSCGVALNGKATTLNECISNPPSPKFEIKAIDTVLDFNKNSKQVISLKRVLNESEVVRLEKNL